jgi:hypothetical protein
MEKAIEEKKNQLRSTRAQTRRDPDEDHETVWDDEESLTEQDEHLDDEDLEYINNILNSISKPRYNHEHSRNLTLESLTPEDALARALASPKTPKKFNLKFNQNSTTRGSEEDHFSYFSNIEEDRTSELGDYFSDDEEDNIWDKEDLTSESNRWSHTDFNNLEENHTPSPHTISERDPVISGLETIDEATFEGNSEANKLHCISCLFRRNQTRFLHMATVYSSRTCLPKLCCSIAAVTLFIAGILITGAYPHPVACTINIVTIVNYAARVVIYDCSGIPIL